MPRFLVVDDHLIVLIGTQHILEAQFPDAEIHIVENFDDALLLTQKFQFDLVILDINIPGGNRLAMIESLRLRQPGVRILIFSAFEETQYAGPYIKAGANGYISKRAGRQEFYNAVTSLMQDRKYLSPHMQQVYIDKMTTSNDPFASMLDRLSQKETEIMNLLTSGLSTNDIASRLSVSAPAISMHKAKIFEKLGVSNIVELKDLLSTLTG